MYRTWDCRPSYPSTKPINMKKTPTLAPILCRIAIQICLYARQKDTQFGLFDAEGHALTLLELADFQADDRLPALIFAKYQDGKWAVLNRDGRHLHFPPLDEYSHISRLGFVGKLGEFRLYFCRTATGLLILNTITCRFLGKKTRSENLKLNTG